MIVEVALSLNTTENFSYEFSGEPGSIKEGMRVIVPVWNRLITGWVVSTRSDYKGRVKPIMGVIKDEFIPDSKYLEFVHEISRTFMISSGKLLDASLSPAMRSAANLYFKSIEGEFPVYKKSVKDFENICKNGVINVFYKIKGKEMEEGNKNSEDGIEDNNIPQHLIYINYYRNKFYNKIWEEEKLSGRTPLILLPNNLSMGKYKNDIQDLQIYNSRIKAADKERLWKLAIGNSPLFIGGGESALFLPVNQQGSIIIEKPGSFFYDKNISSGIDLRKAARIKAKIMGVDIVEGNSCLTSFHYYHKDSLQIRDERKIDVSPVSVKKLNPGVRIPPDQVIDTIINDFTRGDRVLVIVSRRGSFKFLFCPECKSIYKCPLCGGTITISSDSMLNCMSCSYTADKIDTCKKCDSELKIIEDISVGSLKKKLVGRAGEKSIVSFENKSPKDYEDNFKRSESGAGKIFILTPAEVNSIPEKSFDSAIFIKPESFFDLNSFNGGEQIFAFIKGLREVVTQEGKVDVYSVFHFHYSLKNINDEEQYLKRELKYREFFMLPPYCDAFNLEISDRDIRVLSGRMREVFSEFRESLNIKRIYLVSRVKMRGFYKGSIQIHTAQENIFSSGILKVKGIKIRGLL